MEWLLDTNVISETVRDRPDRRVLDWLAAQTPESLAISIVTLAELRDGAETQRHPARRRTLLEWLETDLSDRFSDRTLPLTSPVLVDWLRLARRLRASGRSRDAADVLLAATARVHKLTLVTRNVKHFANTGLVVYDPWTGKTHQMESPDAR